MKLQATYPVMRNGREVFVAPQDLTDDELEDIASKLDREAAEAEAHAEEIGSFIESRRPPTAA